MCKPHKSASFEKCLPRSCKSCIIGQTLHLSEAINDESCCFSHYQNLIIKVSPAASSSAHCNESLRVPFRLQSASESFACSCRSSEQTSGQDSPTNFPSQERRGYNLIAGGRGLSLKFNFSTVTSESIFRSRIGLIFNVCHPRGRSDCLPWRVIVQDVVGFEMLDVARGELRV